MSLRVYWLGRRSYRQGLRWQRWAAERVTQHATLLLLEHNPVYTVGAGGGWELFRSPPDELVRRGCEVWKVGRGGKVTYHGPGQLVGYPILDLRSCGRDVHRFLRMLEDTLIALCRSYGLTAHRLPGKTGVWVHGAKIAAIGVRVFRWVTYHGFAFNVNTTLESYAPIIPCGLPDPVTHLTAWVKRSLSLHEVARQCAQCFAEVFELDPWTWEDASGVPSPPISVDVHPFPPMPGVWVSPI